MVGCIVLDSDPHDPQHLQWDARNDPQYPQWDARNPQYLQWDQQTEARNDPQYLQWDDDAWDQPEQRRYPQT